jgi:hypothetical protein
MGSDVGTEVLRRHHRASARRRENAALAEQLTGVPGIVVAHVGDDGTPIEDMATLVAHSERAETQQKYSTLYIHRIALFCIEVVDRLDFRFSLPMYLAEPFRWLRVTEPRAVLHRKCWNRTE